MSARVYWHGCNYAWSTDGTTAFYGLDFGENVWGSHLGVSTRRAAVARDFAELAALGFTWTRWFVFADGRAGIVYDDRGLPVALDGACLADLDAALEIARDAGVRLDLVLLDHRWMFAGLADRLADPVTGAISETRLPHGRSRVLLTEAGRDALFEAVLAPVVTRYAPGGARADLAVAVGAFELMNEPDFTVEEWEADLSRQVPRPLPFAVLAECAGRLSDLVHARSRAAVTLGGARLRNLWAWDDPALGLDVLQVHTYPDTRHPDRDPELLGQSASSHGLRLPILIGECPCNAPAQHPAWASPPQTTLDDYLAFALSAGYLGAWPWSFSGTDAYGRVPVEPLRRFAMAHPDLVNPRCRFLAGNE